VLPTTLGCVLLAEKERWRVEAMGVGDGEGMHRGDEVEEGQEGQGSDGGCCAAAMEGIRAFLIRSSIFSHYNLI
jgi:hypothetical protein